MRSGCNRARSITSVGQEYEKGVLNVDAVIELKTVAHLQQGLDETWICVGKRGPKKQQNCQMNILLIHVK